MPLEKYKHIDICTTEENKKHGALFLIDKVLEIIYRYDDVEVDEINAYEKWDDDGIIEFFLSAGGTEDEYGDATFKIMEDIKNELKLGVYLGQEDYGCLDMIMLDDNPYFEVNRLKIEDIRKQMIKNIHLPYHVI